MADNPFFESRKLAVQVAMEWAKQLLTLSTGTIVLTGALTKDVLNRPHTDKTALLCCWGLMVVACVGAVLYLGSLTNMLHEVETKGQLDLFRGNWRWMGVVSFVAFVGGLISFIVYAYWNI